MRQLPSTYTAIGRVSTWAARAVRTTQRTQKEAKDARHLGRPEIRRRVEVEVFHDGVGRAEEPAEEQRPHIGMEYASSKNPFSGHSNDLAIQTTWGRVNDS